MIDEVRLLVSGGRSLGRGVPDLDVADAHVGGLVDAVQNHAVPAAHKIDEDLTQPFVKLHLLLGVAQSDGGTGVAVSEVPDTHGPAPREGRAPERHVDAAFFSVPSAGAGQ